MMTLVRCWRTPPRTSTLRDGKDLSHGLLMIKIETNTKAKDRRLPLRPPLHQMGIASNLVLLLLAGYRARIRNWSVHDHRQGFTIKDFLAR
jgi:hypothetical protein